MSKDAGVSGGGTKLNMLDLIAANPALFGASQTQAEAAAQPAPTPMTAQQFYGGSNGSIGQPDQAYFNQFVLPGSQGYTQAPLINPMARPMVGASPTRAEFGAIDERYYR